MLLKNDIKIAVATKDNQVDSHFGHCEKMTIYQFNNGELISEKIIENDNGGCAQLPVILQKEGVKVVIAGNMGAGAIQNCTNNGLETVTGATGSPLEAAKAYLSATLKTQGSNCKNHGHGHGHGHGCGCHSH